MMKHKNIYYKYNTYNKKKHIEYYKLQLSYDGVTKKGQKLISKNFKNQGVGEIAKLYSLCFGY